MDNPEKLATLGTLDIGQRQAKHKRNTESQKKKNLTENRRWTQDPAKGKQFLPLVRHPLCYS